MVMWVIYVEFKAKWSGSGSSISEIILDLVKHKFAKRVVFNVKCGLVFRDFNRAIQGTKFDF